MVTLPTLTESRGIPDIMDTMNYRFEIGQIPGYIANRRLAIQCTQAVYPGVTQEIFQVVFPGGHELNYRGRKVYPKTLSLQYTESVKMEVTTAFGQWGEFMSQLESGTAKGYKQQYALDGPKLYTYDLTGKQVDVITFYGLMFADKPDITYDPSSATPYNVSITLNYDFYYSTLYGPSAPSQEAGASSAVSNQQVFTA